MNKLLKHKFESDTTVYSTFPQLSTVNCQCSVTEDEHGPRNSDTLGPVYTSSVDHTSSQSLWRVNVCVFGTIITPEIILNYFKLFFAF